MSDEREQQRWIRTLGIPMIAAAIALAAALAGTSWLMAAVIACLPGVGLAALLYLTFSSDTNGATPSRRRVVVVGGGFAGVQVVRGLRRAPVDVTLIDRQNFMLFQPLVYQVATGALSPAEIAVPLRSLFRRQRNARVVLGEVTGFDLDRNEVVVERLPNRDVQRRIEYDTLVVAGGSHYSYFGHDEWHVHAPELKSLEGALDIRSRVLAAFEAAEVEPDPARRQAWLTFVIAGAGPTGVEMAGQIAELAHDALRRDFRSAETEKARVLLVEAGDRVLRTFPERLSRKAARALEQLGVTVLEAHTVIGVAQDSVTIKTPAGDVEQVPARTAVWAAGVTASDLAAKLAAEARLDVDRAGRVAVSPDLSLPGQPDVFALGDMVTVQDAGGMSVPLPGLAPVAMQQGRYVAGTIRARLQNRTSAPFRYRDKGNLATIGRSKAVADVHGLRVAGFAAWALWLFVHLFYLIGFQNRLLVLIRWTISFVTRGRGARLIVEREERPAVPALTTHQ
jgi:NADH:quinone reductase (non-electrogenic)